MKLKIKNQLTTNFFVLAKKFANKIFFLNVDVHQIFFDFDANFDAISNNKLDSNKDVDDKTSINATTITKISLNKKDRMIASVTTECYIVEVRELGAASAPGLAFWARVRPNSLTVSETISRRERCLSNKKFETIQEARQKREKKINKLLALKNYTLIYIVVFDNNVLFKQDNRLIVICDINN